MEKLKSFVEGKIFQNTILCVIVFNSVILGLQTSPAIMNACGNVLGILDTVCLGIFIIEMLLKMVANKFIGYFKDGWNWFDFIIILLSLMSGMAVLSTFRVLRVFRVFRSLKSLRTLRSLRGFRAVSALKPLQNIVVALGRSIPGMFWAAALLLIIYYIFSIVGVTLFGEAFPDWFGSIPKTMYTLFQVMTLESWSMGIVRPVMQEFPYAWVMFIPFIVFATYTVMNLFIGIMVNAISEAQTKKEDAEEPHEDANAAILRELRELRAEIGALKEENAAVKSLLAASKNVRPE
jgi:voltage-gated sodium channel